MISSVGFVRPRLDIEPALGIPRCLRVQHAMNFPQKYRKIHEHHRYKWDITHCHESDKTSLVITVFYWKFDSHFSLVVWGLQHTKDISLEMIRSKKNESCEYWLRMVNVNGYYMVNDGLKNNLVGG